MGATALVANGSIKSLHDEDRTIEVNTNSGNVMISVSSPTVTDSPAPTAAPYNNISIPTAAPTNDNINIETESPSLAPTVSPTSASTESPTASPTNLPTASPTKSPIKSPTTSAPTSSCT